VQTNAGKSGRAIESLLIEHGQIRQNADGIGKVALIAGVPEIGPVTFFSTIAMLDL
jgi:hypothetical protein